MRGALDWCKQERAELELARRERDIQVQELDCRLARVLVLGCTRRLDMATDCR